MGALSCNENVRDGKANGAQAIVVMKPKWCPEKFSVPQMCPSMASSQVTRVVLKHCNICVEPPIRSLESKCNSILKPKVLRVKGSDREAITMRANQVPPFINNLTTGHKLQGSEVDALFVHSWHFVTNWVCVKVSRVKTKQGVYLRMKLSGDLKKYRSPACYFGDAC